MIHAFGHGHLGLTLAPITARLVADLIAGRSDPARAAPFAADRFGIQSFDGDVLEALVNMPQASGSALGFNRLVMLATGPRG